ncbi:hypothetical protein C8J57DRAFT_100208 [Mycena rebaudengoi]|nr:hypothetical protein C8J57DRAFT_100208 [Mycena rebaudengoi]
MDDDGHRRSPVHHTLPASPRRLVSGRPLVHTYISGEEASRSRLPLPLPFRRLPVPILFHSSTTPLHSVSSPSASFSFFFTFLIPQSVLGTQTTIKNLVCGLEPVKIAAPFPPLPSLPDASLYPHALTDRRIGYDTTTPQRTTPHRTAPHHAVSRPSVRPPLYPRCRAHHCTPMYVYARIRTRARPRTAPHPPAPTSTPRYTLTRRVYNNLFYCSTFFWGVASRLSADCPSTLDAVHAVHASAPHALRAAPARPPPHRVLLYQYQHPHRIPSPSPPLLLFFFVQLFFLFSSLCNI